MWYYHTTYWTTAVFGRGDAIKPGGDTWILYGGKTVVFAEANVRLSEGFQYRRGSSDGKARIGRLMNGWSWRRRMVWWLTLIFNVL